MSLLLNIEEIKSRKLTFVEAAELLGNKLDDGRTILGVTGRPGSMHTDGVYLTLSSRFFKSVHVKVSDDLSATISS